MSNSDSGDVSKPPSSDVYLLNRDWLASNRLTTQHYVLSSRYGWLVHPRIAASFKDRATSLDRPLRIADVAAGNCIWSIDILKDFPTAEIVAFDLRTDQFPPNWTLPSNIKLETYNVFDVPAEKYLDYFDIVHLRLIIAAYQDGGRDVIVRNIISMAKPGGWVQWQEPESPGYNPVNPQTLEQMPESKWPRFLDIIDENSRFFKSNTHTTYLHEVLRDVGGLTETENYRAPVKNELLRREGDCFLWLFDELRQGLLSGKLTKEQQEEYLKSLTDEAQAMKAGKAWCHNFIVAIGRKS